MNQIAQFRSEKDLKVVLATQYQKQIENFFGEPQKALEFLSNVVAAVQRTPKLLECSPTSVINSFMIMASLKLMPSGVSGEAYVIPYGTTAQFQMGYKGWVTLYYRAGMKKIFSDIVRENDEYDMAEGEITHRIDLKKSMKERGKPIGAYVRFTLASGETVTKYMNAEDIIEHGRKFSKAFNKPDSPWNEKNDPELWMWKKTVLIQGGKLVPKSDAILRALEEDNKDSVLSDRLEKAKESSEALSMGNLMRHGEGEEEHAQGADEGQVAEGSQGEEEPTIH